MAEPMIADHVVEYPGGYTRSIGPAISRYLTGLRDGRILGVRSKTAGILVPPVEYDPQTSEVIGDLDADWVEVGPAGTIESFTWVRRVRPEKQPFSQPFAFAMIKPDGADTAMLHAVVTNSPDDLHIGMRVMPHWKIDRQGSVRDIEAWIPLPDGVVPMAAPPRTVNADGEGPVNGIVQPIKLHYTVSAGVATTRYLDGMAEGKIAGGRAPGSDEVYAASRGTDPKTGEPTSIDVDVADTGCITTFCVVNIPGLPGLAPPVPFVSAHVLLDGADNTIMALIRGCEADEVRMGMRVKAKWAEKLTRTHHSLMHFEPTGEPDAPYDDYKDNL